MTTWTNPDPTWTNPDPTGPMGSLTISQQFLLRADLRPVRNGLRKTTGAFAAMIKAIAAMPTKDDQLAELDRLGAPHRAPPTGHWTEDMDTGKQFYCDHGLTCLSADECHDKTEHDWSKAYD